MVSQRGISSVWRGFAPEHRDPNARDGRSAVHPIGARELC